MAAACARFPATRTEIAATTWSWSLSLSVYMVVNTQPRSADLSTTSDLSMLPFLDQQWQLSLLVPAEKVMKRTRGYMLRRAAKMLDQLADPASFPCIGRDLARKRGPRGTGNVRTTTNYTYW